MDIQKQELDANIQEVEKRISEACKRSGRDRSEVTLIAVSKTKPLWMVEECYERGLKVFGENKAQEMSEKQKALKEAGRCEDIQWNFIGHLQRNKVKYVVGNSYLIHSVDSLRLAEAINERSEKLGVVSDILIEVNVAKEDTKFGVMPEDVTDLIKQIALLKNVKIKGLMTIAPYVDDPEKNRLHFSDLRHLLIDINEKNIDNVNMNVLSMGMTGDYEVAIEEGATMVRVGTGIFGERSYNI